MVKVFKNLRNFTKSRRCQTKSTGEMKLVKLESAKDLETINTAEEESFPAEMENTKENTGSNADMRN